MSVESDLKQWCILIVDDDADNLGVAAEYLQFVGLTVRTATDGVEGMKVLEAFTPHLILMDLSMPNMDGWQMLKEIRANPKFAAIPVLALTAHAMTHDLERVNSAGFNGHITKPFFLATLLDSVKRWLPHTQPDTETGKPQAG